jgi:two-component system response regulator GlrR
MRAQPVGPTVLLVEDNPNHLDLYASQLEQGGFAVVRARSGDDALSLCTEAVHCVVADMMMPGMDGAELMERLHHSRAGLPVIILTGQGKIEESRRLIQERGAFDYVQKTGSYQDFLLRVGRAVEHETLARRVRALEHERDQIAATVESRDPRMTEVMNRAVAVARTPYPVLLTGESGTGKEVLARWIHQHSARAASPLLTVNCGAIPRDLFESELFGHVRGSFTGAVSDRPGCFESAEGGSLFLDEIGEIPLDHQVKLLRVLQDGEVKRIGEARSRRVDVRVLAATHRNLQEMVHAGTFREDLFYRIHVFPIDLPPLRDRREDILPLAQHFLERALRETGRRVGGFSRGAADALRRYPWPGNIRELENKVRQSVLIATGERIEGADLALEAPSRPGEMALGDFARLPLADARQEFEKRYLTALLRRTRGNVSRAAEEAGKHRSEFYFLLHRHAINPADFRAE